MSVKSIDDTSNFDDFPDVALKIGEMKDDSQCKKIIFLFVAAPANNDTGQPYKDWVFINYTFKRFEGLTQRGIPTAKEALSHR